MAEASTTSGSSLSSRSLAVALITLTRYLADRDPGLLAYLQSSVTHAEASKLSDGDLAALRLVLGAIGG